MTGAGGTRSRYALNVSLVMAEHHVTERPAMAAAAGFDQVEMWWPFTDPEPAREDLAALYASLRTSGSRLICLNIDAGDYDAGDRGLLSDPHRRERCRRSIRTAVDVAAETGCRLLNLPYGNRIHGCSESTQHQTAFENLLFAARRARSAGASVVIEPLNSQDNPGGLLPDITSAADLVKRAREAGADNVGILLDVYHLARMGQDLESAIARHATDILHVQFADLPGRRCPGTGELDFTDIHNALNRAAYTGFIGLEFIPLPDLATALPAAGEFVARHPAELPNPEF